MNGEYVSRRLTLDSIRPYLRNAKQVGNEIHCGCPLCETHEAKPHHLYVTERNGELLMYCQHCNAPFADLARAFHDMGATPNNEIETPAELIEDYPHEYKNPDGTLAYCKQRRKWSNGKKVFSFYYYDNGKQIFTKPPKCNVLYNLDLLEQASKLDTIPRLLIVEGEKNADILTEAGLLATTSNTGAQKNIKFTDVDLEMLSRFPDKVVINDNDSKGREYVEAWQALGADWLPITELWADAPPKADIYDYIANGGNITKLIEWKSFRLENINDMDGKELVSDDFLKRLYCIKDKLERTKALIVCEQRANDCGIGRKNFKDLWKAFLAKQSNGKAFNGNRTRFQNAPVGDLDCGDWIADMTGVYRLVKNENDELENEYASMIPIVPSAILENQEDGTEKIAVSFYKKLSWRTVNIPKEVLVNSNKIIELATIGADVSSLTAKLLVKYFSDVINLNEGKALPTLKTVSHLGWYGTEFVPYSDKIETDLERDFTSVINAMESKGTLEEWVEFIKPLRANKHLRLVLCASFASVLVERVNGLSFFVHLYGNTGFGKAQPLDTRIITPYGYKLMGNIKIGDMVIGGDGKPHKVIGVYPQGVKKVYELTFADGRKTKCCKEHLWNVTTHSMRRYKKGYVTMELQEMLKKPIKTSQGFEYQIPLCKPVEYNVNQALPIEPYLLGTLIGDGCLTMKNSCGTGTYLYFSNTENDVIEKVNNILLKHNSYLHKNKCTQCQYVIRNSQWLKNEIKALGLNTYSAKRFIPQMYMLASVEERRELLRGLMDTDGCVFGGRATYTTLSKRLADDVKMLAMSLGYRSTAIGFKRNDKDEIDYIVSISVKGNGEIFTSKKHCEVFGNAKAKTNRQLTPSALAITNIEECGETECQCIMVDSEEHTYLCDDFIVTHNTLSLMLAASVWGYPGKGGLVFPLNSTLNYIARLAGVLKNIPLCGDELQMIKTAYGNYDRLIMTLAEGEEKGRLSKDIIARKKGAWDLCVLTTGEEPIVKYESGGGAVNRVIEVYCDKPITDNGPEVASFITEHYGVAGKAFIECLPSNKEIKDLFKWKQESFAQVDTTSKQIMAMSLLALADCLTCEYIFHDDMLSTEDFASFLKSENEVDASERAYEALQALIVENRVNFNFDVVSDINQRDHNTNNNYIESNKLWGCFDTYEICFVTGILKKEFKKLGYNFDDYKQKWVEKGYIQKFGKDYSKTVRIIHGEKAIRCTIINRGTWV